MALSYVDHSAAVAVTTSASPSYPASVAGDVLMYIVASNSASIPTTLSGWVADPAGVVTGAVFEHVAVLVTAALTVAFAAASWLGR